jgi:hypothetical protein
MKNAALALSAVLALSATAAVAQAPPTPIVVRGALTAVTASSVTVKTDKGSQQVTLAPNWGVAVLKPVAIDAIQPGSFIGTAEIPSKDGSTGRSLEVHVFPPGVKRGEGHYGWDLQPGSMMTNGTVGKVVAGKKGSRELDVSYSYGQRHITVPANVPVVQITGGDRAQLKPGIPVFMVVQKASTGGLVTNSVSIGENGAKPPM